MDGKSKSDWSGHSNRYTPTDKFAFNKLLPTLLSKPARDTSWARKEHKEMMKRFEKSFGGEPLKIREENKWDMLEKNIL